MYFFSDSMQPSETYTDTTADAGNMSEVINADNILAERVRDLLCADGACSTDDESTTSHHSQLSRNEIHSKESTHGQQPFLQKSLFQDVSMSTDMLSEISPNYRHENVSSFIGRVNLDSMNTTRSTEYGDLPGKVDIPQDIADNIARMKVAADNLQKNKEIFKQLSKPTADSVPIQGNIQYHPSSKPSSPLLKVDRSKHAQLMDYIHRNACDDSEEIPVEKHVVEEDVTYSSFTALKPESSFAAVDSSLINDSQTPISKTKLKSKELISQLKSVLTDSKCSFDENPNNSSIDSLAMQVKTLLEEDPNEEKNLSFALHEFENTDLWKYVCQFLPQNAGNQLESSSVPETTHDNSFDYNQDDFVQLVPERITNEDSHSLPNNMRLGYTNENLSSSSSKLIAQSNFHPTDSYHQTYKGRDFIEKNHGNHVTCNRDTVLPPVPGKSAHSSPSKVLVSKCDPDKKLLDNVSLSLNKHDIGSAKSFNYCLGKPSSTDSVVVKSVGSSQVLLLLRFFVTIQLELI